MTPAVVSVGRAAGHTFSKPPCDEITLVADLGVEGDAHQGVTVKHRSRVARDPTKPNLRQVHLIHSEVFDELAEAGFTVRHGDIGENITTRGIDLLGLSTGSRLTLGETAEIEITGLRNPCYQLDAFQDGLTQATLDRGPNGELIRKAGVMAIVLSGGIVRPGELITVTAPPGPHIPLEPV
ncbi:MAG: MOSC domain-containing protein [Pseudomonadota bacterium]